MDRQCIHKFLWMRDCSEDRMPVLQAHAQNLLLVNRCNEAMCREIVTGWRAYKYDGELRDCTFFPRVKIRFVDDDAMEDTANDLSEVEAKMNVLGVSGVTQNAEAVLDEAVKMVSPEGKFREYTAVCGEIQSLLGWDAAAFVTFMCTPDKYTDSAGNVELPEGIQKSVKIPKTYKMMTTLLKDWNECGTATHKRYLAMIAQE